ncbi:MAG: dipicolinate synthase subunit B [Clostridia bacterium]|nr:dipicolinate synthase subunit B [Clostridia bacterium]
MERKTVGFALCGSFCTFRRILPVMKQLAEHYQLIPIMSFHAYNTDTRFGTAEEFRTAVEDICKRPIIHTIAAAEPIGPKKLLDLLVIAPCTGNTLGKLAGGIFDTPVTLAAKAHLRNARPVLVAVSTNDGLTGNAKNIGTLLNTKGYFFVPFGQDDPVQKEASLVAHMQTIPDAVAAALNGKQLQPMLR